MKFLTLPTTASPFDVFVKFYRRYKNVFILESVEGPNKLARYSFIGFDPNFTFKAKNGTLTIHNERTRETETIRIEDPLSAVRQFACNWKIKGSRSRFAGGCVGYISYDAVRYWERLPKISVDDLGYPDIEMGVFEDGIIFDHKNREAYYFFISENRYDEICKVLEEKDNCSDTLEFTEPKVHSEKRCFENSVLMAKEYIQMGHIFQVVLSKRYDFNVNGDLIPFYAALRRINPSPYMYFIKIGDHAIVGSSPEMLIRVEEGLIETYPIAGTRPLIDDPAENRLLERDLLSDPKECAEHVMLVDLARNDLGKVSEPGTVMVPSFMEVHKYSHVQHIVSRVTGKLRRDRDCYDALKAVFPAGTVSGAPKVRAMEIIEELEPVRRGPYAGAVGYFSFNGNADFAITIRTLIASSSRAHIQVGAGIVADSNPEREWFETEYKAKALFRALEISQGGIP
ncbi:MAG: anthranilate synthase component I [Nitrososphaerota archaeon]|nr:anthranilate synthase component I [Nitrososphaerota archaeon]